MSIENRLLDASELYKLGRHEGALLSVLIAAAATARRRYPHGIEKKEVNAFRRFLRDELSRWGCVCQFSFHGRCIPLDEFLYGFLRNHLAHEATMHSDVVFTAGPSETSMKIKVEGTPERFVIPYTLVRFLGYCVSRATENQGISDRAKRALDPS
jgi:hypothetical protein